MALDIHPPARRLAQMRAFAKENGLPDSVAEMLAERGLSAKQAESIKPALGMILADAGRAGHSSDDTIEMVSTMLDGLNGADDLGPEQVTVNAKAAILAVMAKRQRVAGITEAVMVAGCDTALAETLIEEGVTMEQARDRIFAEMAKRTEGAPHRHSPTHPAPAQPQGALAPLMGRRRYADMRPEERALVAATDGLLARMDRSHNPSIGREFASMSLGQMRSAIENGGHAAGWTGSVTMRGAHSTSDFPLVAGNALNLYVTRRFERSRPAILEASHEVARSDYRQGHAVDLSSSPALEVVAENGEIKHVSMDEGGELMPVPQDIAGIFSLSNKLIQNDDVGLIAQAGNRMVEGAIDTVRRMLAQPLVDNPNLQDGNPVFHTARGNIASAGAAPSIETLSEARQAMRTQTDTKGVLLAIEPWAIVCGADLETDCQKLLADLDATKVDDQNPFAGKLSLIVEPALPATEWYLIGDPGRYDGLAHAYLDGRSTPRVEMREGWETLGAQYRVVWAFDAKFIQPLSWFKNPGA